MTFHSRGTSASWSFRNIHLAIVIILRRLLMPPNSSIWRLFVAHPCCILLFLLILLLKLLLLRQNYHIIVYNWPLLVLQKLEGMLNLLLLHLLRLIFDAASVPLWFNAKGILLGLWVLLCWPLLWTLDCFACLLLLLHLVEICQYLLLSLQWWEIIINLVHFFLFLLVLFQCLILHFDDSIDIFRWLFAHYGDWNIVNWLHVIFINFSTLVSFIQIILLLLYEILVYFLAKNRSSLWILLASSSSTWSLNIEIWIQLIPRFVMVCIFIGILHFLDASKLLLCSTCEAAADLITAIFFLLIPLLNDFKLCFSPLYRGQRHLLDGFILEIIFFFKQLLLTIYLLNIEVGLDLLLGFRIIFLQGSSISWLWCLCSLGFSTCFISAMARFVWDSSGPRLLALFILTIFGINWRPSIGTTQFVYLKCSSFCVILVFVTFQRLAISVIIGAFASLSWIQLLILSEIGIVKSFLILPRTVIISKFLSAPKVLWSKLFLTAIIIVVFIELWHSSCSIRFLDYGIGITQVFINHWLFLGISLFVVAGHLVLWEFNIQDFTFIMFTIILGMARVLLIKLLQQLDSFLCCSPNWLILINTAYI